MSQETRQDAAAGDNEGTREDVREGFEAVYGRTPDGVWAAPGRVNLIGEHTDYNDGFVMPLALPHTVHLAAARRDDGIVRLHSGDVPGAAYQVPLDALTPGRDGGWAAYPSGVAWALREASAPVGGADIHLASTVPTGAGLSSSAALEVATGAALSELYDLDLSRESLARLCQQAENDFVGMPCGIMDQMASACCTAGHVLHLDTRDLAQRQVPFDLAAEGLRMLVVDTRVKHTLADGAYAGRRRACEAGAAALGVPALRDVSHEELDAALARLDERLDDPEVRGCVRHVVTENRRVEETIALLDAGRTREVGPVLSAGHASLRDDFRVSCQELDLVVDTALAAGALGARMTGGGFGGSALVLVEEADTEKVGAAVTSAFASAGHLVPHLFEAVPSAGARRL
ncbi:galactokinase [Streptomyces tubbatahanensis]|uniref:galactokinase n=1 Tax=Streptomyces tubbatahanensis TaxID=2923272 RepID=UPI003C6F7176